jgi:protein-disulfide isomerase
MKRSFLVLLIVASWASAPAFAQVPACDALTGDAHAAATRLLDALFAYDCCDESLATCLKSASPARLVKRLAADVCRRVAAGEAEADVRRELEKRAASMPPVARPAVLDEADVAWAGDATAPVRVVLFACARCPFCSKAVPTLHEAVTRGALKGRSRLAVKLFPVRTHPFAAEAATAVEAARALGAFWPFVLALYADFEAFSVERLPEIAARAGLDRAAFEAEVAKPATRERVVAAKKEGVRLGVEATPTVFLDGRLYRGDLKDEALLDVIEEAVERAGGGLCRP